MLHFWASKPQETPFCYEEAIQSLVLWSNGLMDGDESKPWEVGHCSNKYLHTWKQPGNWVMNRGEKNFEFMLRLRTLRVILVKAREGRRAGSHLDRRGAHVMMDTEMEGIWMAEPLCWAHRNDERIIEQLVKKEIYSTAHVF